MTTEAESHTLQVLGPEDLYPMLRAENAEVVIHPSDWKYGALLVGGQGTGKSSAMLTFFENALIDENAAPIVIDPKSELSRICLRMTPPDCRKRVWFLDLGRPAFGMSPLRLIGDRPLAIEAAQIAENVVAALLDINENQIYQSSRRYLYHAVIGAIAIATKQARRARLEDVYTLLRPAKDEFRSAVAEACADQPDLDQTAEFFRSELPDDLKMATSRVAERLDAPRNKISGLTGVPPLRRFFNHPSDVPLREIIEARDVLIVDANMGAIGTENSKACMLFILRMLHAQLQRQVHLPESERPRVPLLVDEAHYVAGGENVVDQIATHRAAGLEPAFGLQYFAQLGSASEHQQKILKGVLNLLQSRFLFRMGDAQDAEQATRIAMAVYSTMIRDDPDSRARLRVTPEQALNFPNYYCLASWIAHGTRAPSFMGRTYPLPDVGDEWADQHLAEQDERVGPYPEKLESTLAISAAPRSAVDEPAHQTTYLEAGAPAPAPSKPTESPVADARQPASTPGQRVKHEVLVDYEPPASTATDLLESPVRRVVGRPIAAESTTREQTPPSDTLRELAFLDRINEIGPAEETGGEGRLPRLYDEDYTILALLDRVGYAPVALIARAALPGRAPRTVFQRLVKLYRHGLIARHTTGLRGHSSNDGKPPLLHSLTRRGLEVAQQREPAPAISPKRGWRPIEQPHAALLAHDLHALGWAIGFHRTVGELATDRWRTARYATGRYPVPLVGNGQRRHPITLNEIPVPDGQAIIDVELKMFTEVKPDLSLELRFESLKLTFDLLVEIDLTARPSYNRDKFLAYDAFLCGWSLAHPRYRALGTRPAIVFVNPNNHAALACAREADELMTGRIGAMGTPAEHWYYAGRDHIFFAAESDIHRGDVSALALPSHPPGLRDRLSGSRELALSRVSLVPDPGLNSRRN
jgi:Replication-relaxation